MINANRKRALLTPTVALCAAVAMPGPAMAQYHTGSDALYYHYYYSDSTYTEQVGWDRDTCNRWGIGRTATDGSWSNYVQLEIWAYCVNGQLSDDPY
jgi:hypothetical protein